MGWRFVHIDLTVVALVAIAVTAIKIRLSWQPLIALFRGARGERAVADVLDDLRARGYRVIHDVPIVRDGVTRANIDHVLIGPAGVFALETKYVSKPVDPPGRRAEIQWGEGDTDELLASGRPLIGDPVGQARRAAKDLARVLHDRLARPLTIRPVVLFPGWWVKERSGSDVWVLEPKRLFTWLGTEERPGYALEARTSDQIFRTLLSY